jgi:protein-tyrosine-phosphatase
MTMSSKGPEDGKPRTVLFACTLNSVRSPMAEAIARHHFGSGISFDSAGVEPCPLDPLTAEVMAEIGLDVSRHICRGFNDLPEGAFDLIISFSPEAHHWATEMTRHAACQLEYWPTVNPGLAEGNREARLAHFRNIRDELKRQILARFSEEEPENDR